MERLDTRASFAKAGNFVEIIASIETKEKRKLKKKHMQAKPSECSQDSSIANLTRNLKVDRLQ